MIMRVIIPSYGMEAFSRPASFLGSVSIVSSFLLSRLALGSVSYGPLHRPQSFAILLGILLLPENGLYLSPPILCFDGLSSTVPYSARTFHVVPSCHPVPILAAREASVGPI